MTFKSPVWYAVVVMCEEEHISMIAEQLNELIKKLDAQKLYEKRSGVQLYITTIPSNKRRYSGSET